MRACLRAARFSNDAIAGARLAGPKGEEVLAILREFIPIRNNDLYRTMIAAACDPDGAINLPSLREDFDFFKRSGLIEGNVTVEGAVDARFVASAVKDLGPCVPAR